MYIITSIHNQTHRNAMNIQCTFCGNNFYSQWASSWNRPSPKYCSRKCMSEGYKLSISQVCASCNIKFIARLSDKRKYCSVQCINRSTAGLKAYKRPSFWKSATEEQKLARYRQIFEDKVIKRDGCWGWKNPPGGSGYGHLGPSGYVINAHRLSWIIHNGPIPNKLWVLHKCHNPICSNPDHLYIGTPKNNTRDMLEAKRGNRSRKLSKNSKLTLAQAKEIKLLLATTGLSQYDIAKKFNVGRGTVQDIKRNKMWKDA